MFSPSVPNGFCSFKCGLLAPSLSLPSLPFPLSFSCPGLATPPTPPAQDPQRVSCLQHKFEPFSLNFLRDSKTLDSPGGATVLIRRQRMGDIANNDHDPASAHHHPVPCHTKSRAPWLQLQKRPEALESALGFLAWLPMRTLVVDLGRGLGTLSLVVAPTSRGSFLAWGLTELHFVALCGR